MSRVLCECARVVVSFPAAMTRLNEQLVERARQKLNAVPIYLANLLRFEEFCHDYGLLPKGWSTEDNRADMGPTRLHEVIRSVIARYAPPTAYTR